jgi:AbrB family looped-hinge helix DNA binding protein
MIYSNSLTSKGQVTLPKQLRDAIGLKTGTKVKVMQLDKRTIAIRAPLLID